MPQASNSASVSSSGEEAASPPLSHDATRPRLPVPPRPAWMWKPRSTLVDRDGNAKQASSLLQLRRLGAKRWHRRFVFLDHHLFCYGKDKGRKDKQIPFELIEVVRRESLDKMQHEHAPKDYAGFGWYLAVKGRRLLFCAESEESAQQWVDYFTALLRAMGGTAAAPLSGVSASAMVAAFRGGAPGLPLVTRGDTLAEIGAQYDQLQSNDSGLPHAAAEATRTSTATAACHPEKPAEGEDRTGASARRELPSRSPPPRAPASISSATTAATSSSPAAAQPASIRDGDAIRAAGASQAVEEEAAMSPSVSLGDAADSPVLLLHQRAGSAEEEEEEEHEDEENSDASVLDVSSEDTEGEGNDGSDSEGDRDAAPMHSTDSLDAQNATTHGARLSASSASGVEEVVREPADQNAAERLLPREVRYARFLLPLAAEPHSHIAYRIPALEPFFRSGDDASGVTFSRTMEKVGKRDNAQPREVVLTTRHLYLFSRARMGGGLQVRCIDTRDITGVVESTTEKTLIAVLIPTFHDLLLKAVSQNSCVPGTPVEVKQQLIAHLYKAHCDLHTDHRFLFRESATVARQARRTVEDKYPAIAVRAEDQMRVGEKPALLQTFAKNADEAVYWSSMVRQVQADRTPQLCALVVTESSLYSLSGNLQTVLRRTSMQDLMQVEFDRDAQTILLQCRGVDVLFNMQSSVEFDAFLRVLPTAMMDGCGRALRLTPSKQLYSHAKLFSLSTLSGAGQGGPAPSSAARRHHHRGFRWQRGKSCGGGGGAAGTRLLASVAAASTARTGEEGEADDVDAFNGGSAAVQQHSSHLRGDYHNTQSIRRFCAQFRFVEEIVRDFDDAVALLSEYATYAGTVRWDALHLRTTFSTRLRVGDIRLSAACRLLDAKECAALARTSALDLPGNVVSSMGTPRAICVTSEGFLFLRNGVAAAAAAAATAQGPQHSANSVPSPSATAAAAPAPTTVREKVRHRLSTAVGHISGSSGGGGAAKDDDLVMGLVGWSAIAAVVRCHCNEGLSLALLTNRSHPSDYLLHLDSAQTMLHVVAAAVGCYAEYRHGTPDHMQLLPVYAAPRAQNLAVALKRTVFDPFPTIALRYSPHSFFSDRLRMAFIPEIADACRRFGDNTLYFSGVAWRVRSATLRRCNGHLEEDPGEAMRRQNNHLYKSYILVVTNVAVYHCTKGGFEVVRRTLLTDITGITVGLHDPDTVMLTVPSEYDMYCRVEGRGAELVARVQEAYVEWTDYGHYLPYEEQGSHTVQAYGLPVQQEACVAVLGTLTKPSYFNELQSSRPAAECCHQTQQWHLRHLRRAIASFERAQAVARKGRRGGGGLPGSQPPPQQLQGASTTWRRLRAVLSERQSFLYFVQRRCFRFGLTSEEFEEMQRAQELLRAYREMEASATALLAATRSTDPEDFQAALQRASAVPDLRLLVEEESARYERYCARHECIAAIMAVLRRYRYRPGGGNVSLAAVESAVLELLREARHLGFDAAFLRYVVQVVRVLTQRTQLHRFVSDPANHQRLVLVEGRMCGGWVLVQQAAREVGMSWTPPSFLLLSARLPADAVAAGAGGVLSSAKRRLNLRVASVALETAARTGEASFVHGAVSLVTLTLQTYDEESATAEHESDEARKEDAVVAQSLRQALETVQRGYCSTNPELQRLCGALTTVSEARQTHQRQQSWTPEIVAALLAKCKQLEKHAAAQPELLTGGIRSVLAAEHMLLRDQQHRQRQLQRTRRREAKAQQQHERALRDNEMAARRATARQQRRDSNAQMHRQEKALSVWGEQVDQLVGQLEGLLEETRGEPEESVRLGMKRCVNLQRWIVEAGTRYGLAAPPLLTVDTTGTSAPAADDAIEAHNHSHHSLPFVNAERAAALAELVAKLQAVVARAQCHLDSRAKIRDHSSSAAPKNGYPAFDGASCFDEQREAPPLPAEVTQCIATLDSAGLVAYIQLHEADNTMPGLLDQIQRQWHLARRRREWVDALHKRLHAAAILRSRELLLLSVAHADAAHYTDAVVEKARRAAAVMSTHACAAEANAVIPVPLAEQSLEADAGQPALLAASVVEDAAPQLQDDEALPTQPLRLFSSEDGEKEATASHPSLEAPPKREDNEDAVEEVTDMACLSSNDAQPEGAVQQSVMHPKLAEVTQATSAVAECAEDVAFAELPDSGRVALRQLHAVSLSLVDAALPPKEPPRSALIESDSTGAVGAAPAVDSAEEGISISPANPHCAAFLSAWRAVLQHHLRPTGIVLRSPRTVWDLVRFVGEAQVSGDFAAPYVTRLCSDFQRLYRSSGDDDAARMITDAVLLAFIFYSHRMRCVLDGVVLLGDGGRGELLFPDALLAQPRCMRALLSAADACDSLQWSFASVQALAMACLFPRKPANPTAVPLASEATTPAAVASPTPPLPVAAPHHNAAITALPSPSASGSVSASPPVQPTSASSTVQPTREETLESMRADNADRAAQQLQQAVHAIADYFKRQLHDRQRDAPPLDSGSTTISSTPAAFFDEHCFPEVGTLVDDAVLPTVVKLLKCGLVRSHQSARAGTLWEVLSELRAALSTNSRTLAGVEVQSIMELVEALTSPSDGRRRFAARLRQLSDEQLSALRVRIFLRECINRRQLYPFIATLFPTPDENAAWASAETGTLWTLYNPALCLLYPPDNPAAVCLRALLEKLSALPFVLVVDRELR